MSQCDSCSSFAVHLLHLPLPLLQERLESMAVNFAESGVMKMEVGSRVTLEAHTAVQKGPPCCCTAVAHIVVVCLTVGTTCQLCFCSTSSLHIWACPFAAHWLHPLSSFDYCCPSCIRKLSA